MRSLLNTPTHGAARRALSHGHTRMHALQVAPVACVGASQQAHQSNASGSAASPNSGSISRLGKAAAALGLGAAAAGMGASVAFADEAEHGLHAPAYPWPHEGFFSRYVGVV